MLAGNTPLSLVGGRGITGPEEVIKYLLAGADTVQTASALMRHGPEYLGRLVEGLTEWIEARGAASVSEVRGRMRANRFAGPEAVFRAHYRRMLLFGYPPPDTELPNLKRPSRGPAMPGTR